MNDEHNNDVEPMTQPEGEPEAKPKRLLLDKRTVRAFTVRSGLRTGACNETSVTGGISIGTHCGRSR